MAKHKKKSVGSGLCKLKEAPRTSGVKMMRMLALELLTWWYGKGWVQLAKNMYRRLIRTSHVFSVPILVRTLFAPWRRIVTNRGTGLDSAVRAVTDNMVSRGVGFMVRLLTLLTASVVITLVMILAVIEIILWPLLPVAVIAALIKGIAG
jgi:hypothetical protein